MTQWYEPLRNITIDILAAQRALSFEMAWFLDPLLQGDYPIEMRRVLGSRLPTFTDEEKTKLRKGVDFIGVNHYTSLYVKDCMFSPCELDKFSGNALVFATSQRNGVPIGASTGMPTMFVVPHGMEKCRTYHAKIQQHTYVSMLQSNKEKAIDPCDQVPESIVQAITKKVVATQQEEMKRQQEAQATSMIQTFADMLSEVTGRPVSPSFVDRFKAHTKLPEEAASVLDHKEVQK
ncbi:probable inactive beta-glucosidase 14 isoform X1 [Asparagus officinalis]|uniref:probable inactive beta-glucosidase 14 isoform X1 n=2 Tax=Asparagus officinalis TaxID=4686 RepID=UPI00098DFEEE|nr:probable inactive beta-glucosidase 14 isoform X1 [Asparagus officinalis]